MSKVEKSDTDQQQFWQMVLETFKSSGLPIRQFCQQEGLSVTFRPTTPPQKIYAAASLAEFSGFFQLPGNSSSILPAG